MKKETNICDDQISPPLDMGKHLSAYLSRPADAPDRLCASQVARITVSMPEPSAPIIIGFFPNSAPKHVQQFLDYSAKGHYDGTIFHRVIPNFMIQGGDPLSKDPKKKSLYGTGGSEKSLKAEFNTIPHQPGILSMARSASPDSAGSQFFIVHGNAPHLDGQYTVWGAVLSGMETVNKIVALPRESDYPDLPTTRTSMKIDVVNFEDLNLKLNQ